MIFIIAQGRAGSTMLWHAFSKIPECTAYLEPLHPDLAKLARTSPYVDPELHHYGVKDHWGAYRTIPNQSLQIASSTARDGRMKLTDYVSFLARKARGRPVFQLNRAWHALPELREAFPEAYFIHMWREPWAQWESAVRTHQPDDYFGEVATWLKTMVPPQLQPGSLERYMFVWAMCLGQGKKFNDTSTQYEMFIEAPVDAFDRLLRPLGWTRYAGLLAELVKTE